MNDLIVYDQTLETAPYILQREQELRDLAIQNLEQAIQSKGYTGPEVQALVEYEMLRLSGDMDLATIQVKANIIGRIEKYHLYTVYPGDEHDAVNLANLNGNMSGSEYSNIKDLATIIFPYIERELDIPIPEFFKSYKKANLRELVPYLKVIITGKLSKQPNVNNVVDQIKNDVAIYPHEGDDDLKRLAVQELMEVARTVTNHEMRKALRPSNTKTIEAIILRRNGTSFILMELDEDQLLMLTRLADEHLDIIANIDLEKQDPLTIPPIKRLLGKGNNGQQSI